MPIKIRSDLPACGILEKENVFVMTEKRAQNQDIRPLKVAIVNLMPTRETTETQLLRVLANTPLQIEISLVRMEQHDYKNTGMEYLEKFYIPSSELFTKKFDGMIVTGAPVEQLPFEEVDYWDELCRIMDWGKKNVFSTLYVCWGAFAGLYHLHGVQKHAVDSKLSGIFMNQRETLNEPLLRGMDDTFPIPQSRHTTIYEDEIRAKKELEILAKSPSAGVTIVKSKDNREIFMTGHLEYDTETLSTEYWRDVQKGIQVPLPKNYYPNNNPSLPPNCYWRSTATLFYTNWLNYYVYQETPFNFTE